jgi:cobalt-precorrin-5B (C1)-methyltransferase
MNNKELKTGFTTGTCAAAAVRGAAALLFDGVRLSVIPVVLPGGGEVTLSPHRLRNTRTGTFCSIIKDAGDDPDVTDGAIISATLSRLDQPTILIEGGPGVGRVTRKGLQISVGEPAINPVPRKMIEATITNFLPPGKGARVVIGVRGGAALARKTFNPRLGIMGGISILGTTGIVEPKSVDALKTSLVCALDIAKAEGHKTIILVPGQIGERGIKKHLKARDFPIVQMSNFVGFMLEKCREKNFQNIILAGHPGKLVKLIRGDFDTHSARSDSALPLVMKEIEVGGHRPAVGSGQPNTVEEIIQGLDKTERFEIFSRLAEKISRAAEGLSQIKVGVVLLSMNADTVGSYLPVTAMEGYFA